MSIASLLRRKLLKLPVYFWASISIASIVGVVIGAVLFSAQFQAHVTIVAVGPNMTIYDSDAATVLATNVNPNVNVLEFGNNTVVPIVHRIYIVNTNPNATAPVFYIRIPGSSMATLPDGSPLPDGITATLTFVVGYSCFTYPNASLDPTGTICSIPIYWYGYYYYYPFEILLNAPSTLTVPYELSFQITITAFDVPFE